MDAKMNSSGAVKLVGDRVFFGIDYAHGRDKAAEIIRLPDNPFSPGSNYYIQADHYRRYFLLGQENNPFVTDEEAREIAAAIKAY